MVRHYWTFGHEMEGVERDVELAYVDHQGALGGTAVLRAWVLEFVARQFSLHSHNTLSGFLDTMAIGQVDIMIT